MTGAVLIKGKRSLVYAEHLGGDAEKSSLELDPNSCRAVEANRGFYLGES